MTGAAELLKARLRADLKAAMQARHMDEAKLLRVLIAAIDNAEAVPVADKPWAPPPAFASGAAEAPRRVLSAQDLADLLAREIAARLDAAGDYARLGQPAEAARLQQEAETIRRYLAA